jgi:hypothetical protein
MRLFNLGCNGKSISITYSEYVFVALGVQRAMRIIVIRGMPCCTILFHILINGTILEKKKQLLRTKCIV